MKNISQSAQSVLSAQSISETDYAFLDTLYHAGWPNAEARERGLQWLAVMQRGTAGTDRTRWVKCLAYGIVRKLLPSTLVADGVPEAAARLRAVMTLEDTEELADDVYASGVRSADAAGHVSAALYNARKGDLCGASSALALAICTMADSVDTAFAAADAADAAEGVHRARLASEMCTEEDGPRHQMLLAAVRVAERAYRATGSPGVELLDDVEEQRWQLTIAEEEIEVSGFELLRSMEKT